MDHVAIMNKQWGLISKILSGEKTIESRWYQTRRAPWNKVSAGDTIFFKNAGELIIASAIISDVLQFAPRDVVDVQKIIQKYGKEICLVEDDPHTWSKLPKYCILMRLKNPQRINKPFAINKQGFGNSTAWITVDSVAKIAMMTT